MSPTDRPLTAAETVTLLDALVDLVDALEIRDPNRVRNDIYQLRSLRHQLALPPAGAAAA